MRATALLLLLGAAAAQESRPAKPFASAKQAYEEAAAAGDASRLAAAVGDLARSGLLSDDRAEKAYARAALKRCLRHGRAEVSIAAARGYATLREPGSTADLRSFLLEAAEGKQPREAGEAAIEAYAAIRDPASHEDLLAVLAKPTESADRRVLARAAASALRSWRALPPKQRTKVIEDFMRAFDRLYTLAKRRLGEDSPEATYWAAIEPEMVRTFNALAETSLSDHAECRDWWLANRRSFAGRG